MPDLPAPEISIVVANWNGASFLRRGLVSLRESAERAGHPFEIIVVDDASTDGSVGLVQAEFPGVRLLVNARNQRFARTSNRGARHARGRVLVMVNNDVIAPPGFIERLTAPFFESAPRSAPAACLRERAAPAGEATPGPLFAVGAKTVDWDNGSPNHLCMYPAWRRGGIGKEWCDPAGRRDRTYVQGGAAAYDRERFLQLGGFDPLFSPGYWEDYDLSYRACKAGWVSLYEPDAVARHLGKGSLLPLLGAGRLARIDERNRLWFVWLNLDDPFLWVRHLLALPWVALRDLRQGRGRAGLGGLLSALPGISGVLVRRFRRRRTDPPVRLGDRAVMGLDAGRQD